MCVNTLRAAAATHQQSALCQILPALSLYPVGAGGEQHCQQCLTVKQRGALQSQPC